MRFQGLPCNDEWPSLFHPWINIPYREHDEIHRPDIVRLPPGGDQSREMRLPLRRQIVCHHGTTGKSGQKIRLLHRVTETFENLQYFFCLPCGGRVADSSINVVAT